jgi:predicted ATPase
MGRNVYIIAGPDGAGKTTFAREFLANCGGTRRSVAREVLKRIYLLGIKVFWLAAQRQTPFCLIQVSVKRTR